MQVTETQSEGLKHEFQVVIAAQDIETKLMSKLSELAGSITMPGFRPGKVPVSLLRKVHGKRVMGEVLEETVNETASKALEENNLRPALQPKIEIKSFDDGADLEYSLAVEVMPEFETGNFGEMTLERLIAKVEDSVVEERLIALAEQMKTHIDAAEGEAANEGDAVVIDFVGTVDGEAFEGGSAEEFQLELGQDRFIPGFEEQLVGAKKDESRKVEVTFPENYQAENLANKTAVFAVTVKAVKVPLPAAVDDALAEKLGLENLEALRTTFQQQLETEYSQASRARLKRTLLDSLAESYDFELPSGMVDMELDAILEQLEHELENQNKTMDDLEEPEETVKAEYRTIAERRVRLGLLLSEVGRLNNIEVTQDEINRAIMERARALPGQEQRVFEFYQQNPDQQAQLRAPILEEKVCDYIIEMATVTEREVSLEELVRDPDAEDDSEASKSDEQAAEAKSKPKRKPTAKKKKAKAETSKKDDAEASE